MQWTTEFRKNERQKMAAIYIYKQELDSRHVIGGNAANICDCW